MAKVISDNEEFYLKAYELKGEELSDYIIMQRPTIQWFQNQIDLKNVKRFEKRRIRKQVDK